MASAVACAVLDVREVGDGIPRLAVSGAVARGAPWEEFLRRLRDANRDVDDTTQTLEPGICPVLAVVADIVQRTRAHGTLRLTAPDAPVPIGEKLGVRARATAAGTLQAGTMQADMYGADGSVRHLTRRGMAIGAEVAIDSPAPGPVGQQLLVIIVTAAPLHLAQRPASESAAAYLPALRAELDRVASSGDSARTELALLSIVPALIAPPRPAPVRTGAPPPAPPQQAEAPRAPRLNNARCADIVARVQLGGVLSDEDRSALRTSCRP